MPSSTPTSTTTSTELRIALFSFFSQPPIHPPGIVVKLQPNKEFDTSAAQLVSTQVVVEVGVELGNIGLLRGFLDEKNEINSFHWL